MEGRDGKAKPLAPIFPNTVATFAAGPLDQSRDPELFFFFFSFSFGTPYSMENLSSLTRDRTCAPCIGSGESELLDHQVSPRSRAFNLLLLPIAI